MTGARKDPSYGRSVSIRYRPFVALLVTLLAVSMPTASTAQTSKVPVAIDLALSQTEVRPGETLGVSVTLRNIDGTRTKALEAVRVTLKTSLLGEPVRLVIPRGEAVAETELRFERPGVATVEAKAAKLAGDTAVVAVASPVRPSARLEPPAAEHPPGAAAGARGWPDLGNPPREVVSEERRRTEVLERRMPPVLGRARIEVSPTVADDAPAPSAPAASAPPSPVFASLRVDVMPPRVHPSHGAWEAVVRAFYVDQNKNAVRTTEELPVQFVAEIGRVEPSRITIPSGSTTHAQDVRIISRRPGRDTVRAWTAQHPVVESSVDYETPVPSRLRVLTDPPRVTNSGKAPIHVVVFLRDETDHPASFSDRDLEIQLRTTRGELTPRVISVGRGKFVGEATLTSATSGEALISASALGMADDTTNAWFLFPWLLVSLATMGGLGGATLRDNRRRSSRPLTTRFGKDLIVGGALGLIFYSLTLFGAVGSIPKAVLSINLGAVPTLNELGAFVLGFVGGYFGRRLL